jgi:hypothetical protein
VTINCARSRRAARQLGRRVQHVDAGRVAFARNAVEHRPGRGVQGVQRTTSTPSQAHKAQLRRVDHSAQLTEVTSRRCAVDERGQSRAHRDPVPEQRLRRTAGMSTSGMGSARYRAQRRATAATGSDRRRAVEAGERERSRADGPSRNTESEGVASRLPVPPDRPSPKALSQILVHAIVAPRQGRVPPQPGGRDPTRPSRPTARPPIRGRRAEAAGWPGVDSPSGPGPPRTPLARRRRTAPPRPTIASGGGGGSRKPAAVADRPTTFSPAQPAPSPAPKPGAGVTGVGAGAERSSTVSVESATRSLSVARRRCSESRSASRRASSDSTATTSPIDVAWASNARTRVTLACWVATRGCRSTTCSVASSARARRPEHDARRGEVVDQPVQACGGTRTTSHAPVPSTCSRRRPARRGDRGAHAAGAGGRVGPRAGGWAVRTTSADRRGGAPGAGARSPRRTARRCRSSAAARSRLRDAHLQGRARLPARRRPTRSAAPCRPRRSPGDTAASTPEQRHSTVAVTTYRRSHPAHTALVPLVREGRKRRRGRLAGAGHDPVAGGASSAEQVLERRQVRPPTRRGRSATRTPPDRRGEASSSSVLKSPSAASTPAPRPVDLVRLSPPPAPRATRWMSPTRSST